MEKACYEIYDFSIYVGYYNINKRTSTVVCLGIIEKMRKSFREFELRITGSSEKYLITKVD